MNEISKDELMELLPHKGKMFLLSKVISYNTQDHSLVSEVDIKKTDIFFDYEMHGIPSYVCFEYMAQSISAFSGISNKEKGISPKVGVILSVSNFKTFIPVFDEGKKVRIEVRRECCLEKVFIFLCSAFIDDKKAAEGRLSVMEVENITSLK